MRTAFTQFCFIRQVRNSSAVIVTCKFAGAGLGSPKKVCLWALLSAEVYPLSLSCRRAGCRCSSVSEGQTCISGPERMLKMLEIKGRFTRSWSCIDTHIIIHCLCFAQYLNSFLGLWCSLCSSSR